MFKINFCSVWSNLNCWNIKRPDSDSVKKPVGSKVEELGPVNTIGEPQQLAQNI